VTEVLADSGMDFVCIDVEHSGISLETVAHNIRAAQAALCPPVVRVAGLGPGQPNFKEIMRVLDLGATAVIVPGILSKTEVQAAIGAGQFTKTRMTDCDSGFRGANPFVRAGRHGLQVPSDYHRRSNAQTLIIPLLETPSALQNVEDIMQVEGLQVVAFGPFDLSVAMGFDGERTKEVRFIIFSVWGAG
jgi:4-hydroxy-2-oxoheptanedioate aldolase